MSQRINLSYVLNIALTLTKQGHVSAEEIGWLRKEMNKWFTGLFNFKSLF